MDTFRFPNSITAETDLFKESDCAVSNFLPIWSSCIAKWDERYFPVLGSESETSWFETVQYCKIETKGYLSFSNLSCICAPNDVQFTMHSFPWISETRRRILKFQLQGSQGDNLFTLSIALTRSEGLEYEIISVSVYSPDSFDYFSISLLFRQNYCLIK